MGEMTIRLDDALMLALQDRAGHLGTDVEHVAADLLRRGLMVARSNRMEVARAIQARSTPSSISSVDLLDQIRDEGL